MNRACPVSGAQDSDGDGIDDEADLCPGTPMGASVTMQGCWVIEGLLFNSGKSTIQTQSEAGLDDIVKILEENPDIKLEIQGHTDSTGSLAINNKISRQRAQAVKDYMVGKAFLQTV